MREEKNLFSIIVPVYNVEKYLDKCLESILRQTFKDFKCIIIDDDSHDKSNYRMTHNKVYNNVDRTKFFHKRKI